MPGSPDLSVDIGRLRLKNPVMPASGTFGYGQEYASFFDLNRLGAVIVKTITLKPRIGSYPHRSVEVASGSLASIGLQNVGVERFVHEYLPFFGSLETPLIVNVGGQTLEEYVKVASVLDRHPSVSALELNISCPNVSKGGLHFGVDPQVTRELVTRVRQVTEKNLIVKLTPMVTDIRVFAEASQAAGADTISLINGLVGMAIDVKTRRSKLHRNVTGGLTGPAIKPLALYLVRQVCKTVDIPVIGVGGIATAVDALEFLVAGASAVEIGTYNFVNPCATIEVLEGIETFMADNGIRALSEVIGTFQEPGPSGAPVRSVRPTVSSSAASAPARCEPPAEPVGRG